jgi:UDP-N-acetylglucosamine 2-epimerase (hydrolysing)
MILNKKIRKVIFLTGTRADFGKLKSLMQKLEQDPMFETHIFVTGMHMLSKYGSTADEVRKSGFKNIYKFINQNVSDSMDHILAKTVSGFSDYVKEMSPDLLVVHGDRIEALAGGIVGALNNILVAHIEGGEVSGTIDEVIRHAVSKLSHLHFVSNETAKNRLIQLGEIKNNIHIIGSPDIDIMNSTTLPELSSVMKRYAFNYSTYSILLFHPVTTDISNLQRHVRVVVDQVLSSGLNYIVIYPNNDFGTEIILDEYRRFDKNKNIKIFPSMRFEYFLTALKNSNFIIGNSSAGIREAPHFGVPAINLGSRQKGRVECPLVLDTPIEESAITSSIFQAISMKKEPSSLFGDGDSADKFYNILKSDHFWDCSPQKYFVDQEDQL